MKKILTLAVLLCISATSVVWYGCKKNAAGRNTLSLVDDATILSLSQQEYASFMSANPPVTGTPQADMVKRVGARLTAAVQEYLAQTGQADLVANYQWEFNLVNNPEVNAWCLPGGKIVVYTGIMSLISSDAELATVMGHEIAHAVLKHGNERMSQQLLVQYGGTALSVLLSSKPQQTQALFSNVYGISSSLGVLSFSRKQESEADESGLYYMAVGDYDPNNAVGFWQKMAQQGDNSTPVFLSSHPSDEQRIENIKSLLPKALAYYNP